MDTYKCSICGKDKPASEFFARSKQCKPCRYERARNHPDRKQKASEYRQTERGQYFQRKSILKKYGLTVEEYNELLKEQDYVCKICGKPERRQRQGVVTALIVDHCHATLINRGLLCDDCNVALGRVHDDIEVLKAMIEYLEEE